MQDASSGSNDSLCGLRTHPLYVEHRQALVRAGFQDPRLRRYAFILARLIPLPGITPKRLRLVLQTPDDLAREIRRLYRAAKLGHVLPADAAHYAAILAALGSFI